MVDVCVKYYIFFEYIYVYIFLMIEVFYVCSFIFWELYMYLLIKFIGYI